MMAYDRVKYHKKKLKDSMREQKPFFRKMEDYKEYIKKEKLNNNMVGQYPQDEPVLNLPKRSPAYRIKDALKKNVRENKRIKFRLFNEKK